MKLVLPPEFPLRDKLRKETVFSFITTKLDAVEGFTLSLTGPTLCLTTSTDDVQA